MASDDVLERHASLFRTGPYNSAEEWWQMADALAAEVRERLKDKARLDWLLGRGAMTVVDGDEIYVDRVQLDAAMGATENG